jgi:hypothetical protein
MKQALIPDAADARCREEMAMKIVARIEKVNGDQYLFEGKIFDTFLNARRAMSERVRARRRERQLRASRFVFSQSVGA